MASDAPLDHRNSEDLLERLAALGVVAETIRHPPVHTVEEALPHWAALDALHTKNLLLKDAKDQLWLIAAPTDRVIDLKRLPGQIGSKRLSFAKEELLFATLGVRQGAVSPFALINDREKRVRLVLDAALMAAPRVAFHPLTNTATTAIRTDDLRVFLGSVGSEPLVVALDAALEDTTP
ncbi:prolyl-tRNA synthetase associated domain-containing protein [Azospirillum sp.]|uniref:prolyl-tRNA synthetase associated domain-containing protein n=1 Tax=Azospirillum sp. TaxID=34012 RepID=UPI00260C598B|nr:prolyl-tRNA synthetase associated domain-containing protein [Azospirillum sp.]